MPTFYSSADSGAPVVGIANAGDALAMMRACLSTGYGALAAAGWSEPYTGTNIAAFQNNVSDGGTGMLCRVDDTIVATTNPRQITLNAYRTMSDVDTGTDGLSTRYGTRRPGNTNSVTTVDWICAATSRTAYFALWQAGQNIAYNPLMWFGDIQSFVAMDAFRYFVAGTNAAGASGSQWLGGTGTSSSGSPSTPPNANGGFRAGADYAGVTKNIGLFPWPQWGGDIGGASSPARPSVTDATEVVVPMFLGESSNIIRGRMPGVYIPWSNISTLNTGDMVYDVVAPGSILVLMKGSNTSGVWVEIGLPWDY